MVSSARFVHTSIDDTNSRRMPAFLFFPQDMSCALNHRKQSLIRCGILYNQLGLPIDGQHLRPASQLESHPMCLGIAVKICKGCNVLDSDLGHVTLVRLL